MYRPTEDKVIQIITAEERLQQLGGDLTEFEQQLAKEYRKHKGNLHRISRLSSVNMPVHILDRVTERLFKKLELIYLIEGLRDDIW